MGIKIGVVIVKISNFGKYVHIQIFSNTPLQVKSHDDMRRLDLYILIITACDYATLSCLFCKICKSSNHSFLHFSCIGYLCNMNHKWKTTPNEHKRSSIMLWFWLFFSWYIFFSCIKKEECNFILWGVANFYKAFWDA